MSNMLTSEQIDSISDPSAREVVRDLVTVIAVQNNRIAKLESDIQKILAKDQEKSGVEDGTTTNGVSRKVHARPRPGKDSREIPPKKRWKKGPEAENEDNSERSFVCEYGCGYAANFYSELRNHMATHAGVKPFTCPEDGCGATFVREKNMKSHMRAKHIPGQEKLYPCTFPGCGAVLKSNTGIKFHMKSHTRDDDYERPFPCPYEGCGAAFTTTSSRNVHIKVHTGEKPHLCQFPGCGKTFRTAGDHVVHVRTHTGERPYVCPFEDCDASYCSASALGKHVKRKHHSSGSETNNE